VRLPRAARHARGRDVPLRARTRAAPHAQRGRRRGHRRALRAPRARRRRAAIPFRRRAQETQRRLRPRGAQRGQHEVLHGRGRRPADGAAALRGARLAEGAERRGDAEPPQRREARRRLVHGARPEQGHVAAGARGRRARAAGHRVLRRRARAAERRRPQHGGRRPEGAARARRDLPHGVPRHAREHARRVRVEQHSAGRGHRVDVAREPPRVRLECAPPRRRTHVRPLPAMHAASAPGICTLL
jgi:hypothetical protein